MNPTLQILLSITIPIAVTLLAVYHLNKQQYNPQHTQPKKQKTKPVAQQSSTPLDDMPAEIIQQIADKLKNK